MSGRGSRKFKYNKNSVGQPIAAPSPKARDHEEDDGDDAGEDVSKETDDDAGDSASDGGSVAPSSKKRRRPRSPLPDASATLSLAAEFTNVPLGALGAYVHDVAEKSGISVDGAVTKMRVGIPTQKTYQSRFKSFARYMYFRANKSMLNNLKFPDDYLDGLAEIFKKLVSE